MTNLFRFRAAAAGALLVIIGAFPSDGNGFHPSSPPPAEWEIKMTIKVKGDYELAGRTRSTGRYQLAFTWSGGLEQDQDDYILLKGRSEMTEWTAEESTTSIEGVRILTTSAFDEIPDLNVAYVLMQRGRLHVSFIVHGFGVPRALPFDRFYLHLPASAEGQERPSGVNYNLFVKSGSNSIVMDDPALTEGTQEKTFRWTFVRRTANSENNRGLFEMNRHEAEVTVAISPVKKSGRI